MPANEGRLVELTIGLIFMGGLTAAFGCYLIRQSWRNFREGRVPLTSTFHLSGLAGRIGAFLLIAAGVACVMSGIVVAAAGLWRLPSLLAGN